MIPWLALALGAVAAVEAGVRLPFRSRLAALRRTVSRVVATASSSGSERRKQAVLVVCSRRLLAGSAALFLLLAAVLSSFLAAVGLAELAGHDAIGLAASRHGLVGCALAAAGYAVLRRHVAGLFRGGQAAAPSGP